MKRVSQTDVFGWQDSEEKSSPASGGQAEGQAEGLSETKLQTASDFDEEFVPGTMCKLAPIPLNWGMIVYFLVIWKLQTCNIYL